MLESYKHAKNAFVTLTYNDENLPKGGHLVPKDLQKFFKRLRYFSSNPRVHSNDPQSDEGKNLPIRYFACGEYGDTSWRPHYHAAVFGLGPEDSELINEAWGLGFTFTGDLTRDSAQYVAGYVTKKMTQALDPRLNGLHPEFARMSLRPGIGASAVADIADTLTEPAGCDALSRVGDVPHSLMLERKSVPLGKYLRGKLREKLNFPDKKSTKESLDAWKEEMQKLRDEYKASPKTSALSKYFGDHHHFKNFLIDKNAQKVLQLETRSKIYSAKKDKL